MKTSLLFLADSCDNEVYTFDSPILGEYEVVEDCTVKFIDPATCSEISRGVVVDNGSSESEAWESDNGRGVFSRSIVMGDAS